MVQLAGGEILVRCLRPEKISAVFGVVGGKLGPFIKALGEEPGIVYTGTRHEAAAAYMAAAHFAATGQMAVAFSEIGPGTSNAVPAVASAYNNRLPLLLITSNNQHATSYPFRGAFMEQDNLALLRPITKWNAVVHDGARIPELMRWAFREALTGRPGPVHLDVPQDVLQAIYDIPDAEFAWTAEEYRLVAPIAPAAADVQRAAEMLSAAKRPLLIAGGGLARGGDHSGFRALALTLGAASVGTQMGLGVADEFAAGFAGQGGVIGGDAVIKSLREADVVLAAGCRFSSWMWDQDGPLVRHGQKLIQIDIDPAVIGHAAPVTLGMVADARTAVAAILDAVRERGARPANHSWIGAIDAARAGYVARLSALTEDTAAPTHPARLARAIGEAIPAGAFVTFDGGHTSFWSNDFTRVAEPRQCFHEPGMAQLGFGLPYAIAVGLAHPGRPVVNIAGDGAFGFTLAELDTARRYEVPVINVIHNNASWGVIGFSQHRSGFSFGADLSGTDYAAIARGFGCFGELVGNAEDFSTAFAHARASGLPAVLDCRTRFVPHPMMPNFGATSALGMRR